MLDMRDVKNIPRFAAYFHQWPPPAVPAKIAAAVPPVLLADLAADDASEIDLAQFLAKRGDSSKRDHCVHAMWRRYLLLMDWVEEYEIELSPKEFHDGWG